MSQIQATSCVGVHQQPLNPFQRLVEDLREALGQTPRINSAEVDVEGLEQLMRNYDSNELDWGKFALADSSTNYTRNLVDQGNGTTELLILVWNPSKGSPVHDHADAHCIMRILKGSIKETRYAWPDKNISGPLQVTQEETVSEGDVSYMSDQLGLHTIMNPDPLETAVSLHLYSPPNAAKDGFSIYSKETGKATPIKQSHYYSKFGKRILNHAG
ncbi:MAG: hypothetical protein M1821_004696 [Bathelium mastoideum]|nr:MAG: hypothetical protein M1821_004696 [Bathelium mastoideum]